MKSAEQRVQDAFSQIKAPQSAVDAALARIAELRVEQERARGGAAKAAPDASGGAASAGSSSAEAAEPSPSGASARIAPRVHRGGRGRARRWLAAACVVLAAVGLLGGGVVFMQPTAYMGIDVNPSIELGVNRFDVVVCAEGLNDDGEAVLAGASVLFKPVGQALDALTGSDSFAAYVRDDGVVEITVTADDERQAEYLCAQGDHCLAGMGAQGSCRMAGGRSATRPIMRVWAWRATGPPRSYWPWIPR